jgi:RNA polymerase sigma-70 factor, ECF subfamily
MSRSATEGSTRTVTRLLNQWQSGDAAALEKLVPLVYAELRLMARRRMAREGPGHTLQSTALVHEAFLRLVGQREMSWQNRAQFFGIAAQVMRRILVDHARRRRRAKRGAGAIHVDLDAVAVAQEGAADPVDVLALEEALRRLETIDPRQMKIVELRYFAGLSVDETASALGLSPATVKREWAMARAWLHHQMESERRPG